MTGIQLDTEREMLRELDRSLVEWGRWSNDDIKSCIGLGYPSSEPFTRVRGKFVEDVDMGRVMEIENGYTVWKMVTLASTSGAQRRHNLMLLFILKIHYCEPGDVSDKAHHTGKLFHRSMGRSTYYKFLHEARLKLARLIY